MCDMSGATARVALVAACMARDCTPAQTALVLQELQTTMPPALVSEVQQQLEAAISRAKEIKL